jgi:hypothetical protein
MGEGDMQMGEGEGRRLLLLRAASMSEVEEAMVATAAAAPD